MCCEYTGKKFNKMKKKRISEISNVASIETTERLMAMSSDKSVLKTISKSNLLNVHSLSSYAGFTGDNAHTLYDTGLTILNITSGVANYNFPSNVGMLMIFNRLGKNMVSLNQYIFQILLSPEGAYYRYGRGNEETIVYQPWKMLAFV